MLCNKYQFLPQVNNYKKHFKLICYPNKKGFFQNFKSARPSEMFVVKRMSRNQLVCEGNKRRSPELHCSRLADLKGDADCKRISK